MRRFGWMILVTLLAGCGGSDDETLVLGLITTIISFVIGLEEFSKSGEFAEFVEAAAIERRNRHHGGKRML